MSTKYKFTDTTATYFATSTVVDWIDVLTREDHKTMVLKNIKSFAALKIIDAIIKNPQESRKDCLPAGEAGMLGIFEENGRAKKTNYHYQFWQHENHPVLPEDYSMLEQRVMKTRYAPVL